MTTVITPPLDAGFEAADEVVPDAELDDEDELPHALNATIEASASKMVETDLLLLLTSTSS
jgi:hypothetical protein